MDADGDAGEDPEAEQVYRSPADLLRLVVALGVVIVLLVVDRLFGNAVLGFLADVLSGVSRLPSWLLSAAVIGTRLLTTIVLVAGFIAVVWQRRVRLLVMAALGALAGGLLAAGFRALLRAAGTTAVEVNPSAGVVSTVSYPSAVGLAVAAGVVTACAPWLSRRWRRLTWTMIVGLTVSRLITAPISLDSLLAVAAGWLAGAGLLLITGGPHRRPTTRSVSAGLAAVGLPLATLDAADVDARGSTPYFGTSADGRGVFVKVLGTDERDADILFRLYRRIQPRDLGDEKPFSSLRRTVEHEALVSLTARSMGIPTPQVLAFATVEPNAFVLAYETIEGKSLDRVPVDQLTDDVVRGLWQQLHELRRRRIAHRDLRLANLFLKADGQVMLIDFGFSELAASDLLLANDLAELLCSLALAIGVDRSYESAVAVVGADVLSTALPRLKPFALSGATRTGLTERPEVLDDLRTRLTRAGESTDAPRASS